MSDGDDIEPPHVLHEAILKYSFSGMTQDQYLEMYHEVKKAAWVKRDLGEIRQACEALSQQISTDPFLDVDTDYASYAGKEASNAIKSAAE